MTAFRRTACRLCGGNETQTVLSLAPTPIGDEYVSQSERSRPQPLYPIDVLLCRRCGHAQLADIIDPSILYGDYIYKTSDSLGLVDHFRRYAAQVLQAVAPSAGALAVDIGSNDGTLLRFLQERGLRVLGVDPASELARQATS